MPDEIPDEIDLLVVGSGFPESCIAAAASRIGKQVVHVDPNDFYGGVWGSFALDQYVAVLQHSPNGEMRNGSVQWHCAEQPAAPAEAEGDAAETPPQSEEKECTPPNEEKECTASELLQKSRKFCIDLTPKILYANGELVKLLISSNICRYAEFRAVDCVCTRFHDHILSVPCTRGDVFNTKDLSIVEKRLLMKFLNKCITFRESNDPEDDVTLAEYATKTFREYLTEQKVTDKIITCVMQAISMATDETPFAEGIANTKKFLQCLGRYGNTPFLSSMYGCGEIPQCFCRLSAVFGGIYCLKYSLDKIQLDADSQRASMLLEDKRVYAKNVVFSHDNVPPQVRQQNRRVDGYGEVVNALSRGVYLATTPLGSPELNKGGGGVNVLRLVAGSREAILIQLSHRSGTCPEGIYLFHITTPAVSDNPADDLQPFTSQVFTESIKHAPNIVFSSSFTLTARSASEAAPSDATGPGLYCTAAPFYEWDYSKSIENARGIFHKMFPDAEFLPRAPDPEEIIVDGEDPLALNEIALADDLREQLHLIEGSGAAEPQPMDTDNADGEE